MWCHFFTEKKSASPSATASPYPSSSPVPWPRGTLLPTGAAYKFPPLRVSSPHKSNPVPLSDLAEEESPTRSKRRLPLPPCKVRELPIPPSPVRAMRPLVLVFSFDYCWLRSVALSCGVDPRAVPRLGSLWTSSRLCLCYRVDLPIWGAIDVGFRSVVSTCSWLADSARL
jgi:hypothetical protein